MSTEIEAYTVIVNGKVGALVLDKEDADELAKLRGGTVVKLTGKMPRELRKVSTEVWISPCEVMSDSHALLLRMGFGAYDTRKFGSCTVKARITLEELPEEGE